MAAAFFLLECFDKLIFEGEPDSKLWDFLLAQLHIYNSRSLAKTDWSELIAITRHEILKTLGYDPSIPVEYLANTQFKSSQFITKVLG